MKAVVRQDELEDLVGTVCQTFLGLTVQLRPLPRSQVRPDPPDGVLPAHVGAGRRATRRARRDGGRPNEP